MPQGGGGQLLINPQFGTLTPYTFSRWKLALPTHPHFLLMTRQGQAFPPELGIKLDRWEVVEPHAPSLSSLFPILPSLAPFSLDLDVGNETLSWLLSS